MALMGIRTLIASRQICCARLSRCSAPTPNKVSVAEGTPLRLPAHGLRPRYPCSGGVLCAEPSWMVGVAGLGEGGFGGGGERAEGGSVADSEIGHDLAVEGDAGQVEAMDELAVGEAVGPDGGVDPDDPEAA